ncbi:hypothetical protein DAI22_11g175800 [Oryza sativa Japonica Group]|nr:hypothetical protein DAI22_11g175800 [Oryza sativa Japonica Group]
MALLGASSKRVEKAKANIIIRKMNSKFKLRMFCRTTGAIALLKLSQPNADELGYADSVSLEDIGGVRNEEGRNSVAIAVLRGSTDSILDDLGRAVDDGVNTYKSMCRDSRIIPGAAATEIELAKRLKEFSLKETGYAGWTTMPLQNLLEVLKWFQEPRLKMLGLVLWS